MIMNDIFDSKGTPDVKTGTPVKLDGMRRVMNWGHAGSCPATPDTQE